MLRLCYLLRNRDGGSKPLPSIESSESVPASPASAVDSNSGPEELQRKCKEAAEALQSHDTMRAREVIQQVIAVDPKFSGAHLILGAALWAQNHLEDALAEMRKEEEVSPNDTRPVQSAARLATFLRRGDEAIMEWRRLLKNGVTSKAH